MTFLALLAERPYSKTVRTIDIRKVKIRTENWSGCVYNYPALIRSCFRARSLEGLNRLWQACKQLADDSPQSELVWLTIIAILCHVSCVGTAPWQYILPNKPKNLYCRRGQLLS